MADLKSSDDDIKNVSRQECCTEHEDEILGFYCKTCEVLICHECIVTDHPESSHIIGNMKRATKELRLEIGQLVKDCNMVKCKVEESLKTAEKVQDNLERSLEKAKTDLHQATEAIRAKVLADIKQKETELEAKLIQAATDNKNEIDTQKESLILDQGKLHTELQEATEVTEAGSDFDLALVYSSTKSNLTRLREMKPEHISKGLGEIKFVPNKSGLSVNLGYLSIGKDKRVKFSSVVDETDAESLLYKTASHVKVSKATESRRNGVGTWKLVSQFGQQNRGKLLYGRSIAMTGIGDFIVADCDGKVNMYNHTGDFKLSLYTKHGLKFKQRSYPWNVVASPDGRIFITQCVPHVNVYNTKGTYKYLFHTKSPSNYSCTAKNADLWGLAMDNQGHLLVGEVNHKYISKHTLDGSHIGSFKVTIAPGFIAVTPSDLIVVSHSTVTAVHVIDTRGNILHMLKPPSGIAKWWPYGLCCTAEDEVYIANYRSGNDAGIYCYSVSGQYLGCITKEVEYPSDFALTEDGNKLIVVESQSVKIFCRQ